LRRFNVRINAVEKNCLSYNCIFTGGQIYQVNRSISGPSAPILISASFEQITKSSLFFIDETRCRELEGEIILKIFQPAIWRYRHCSFIAKHRLRKGESWSPAIH